MDDATLLLGLLAYAALLMGFVFMVARDPPAWGQGPGRMTVWFAVALLVAGPLGLLLVLAMARRTDPRLPDDLVVVGAPSGR